MAPSQHLRLMLGSARTRTSRPAGATALLLGATLALSGCGAQRPDAAAVVNDTVIRDQDVQIVSDQVNEIAEVSVNNVLVSLILAPYVLAEAERTGKTVSASQARKVIAKVSEPADSTITFVRMQLAVQQLDEASQAAIVKALGQVKVTVNPRYGVFDPAKIALTPNASNWFAKAGSAAPIPAK